MTPAIICKYSKVFYHMEVDFFFHICNVHCDIIEVFYSQTNAQVIVLKTILKFTFTFT